jgi:hypothetical protein
LFGVRTAESDAWIGVDDEPVEFEVWPENWLTLQIFLSLATQWHWTGGMEPRRAGLFYPSFGTAWEEFQIPRQKRPAIISGVRTMELAVLEVWSSK